MLTEISFDAEIPVHRYHPGLEDLARSDNLVAEPCITLSSNWQLPTVKVITVHAAPMTRLKGHHIYLHVKWPDGRAP